MLWPNKSLFLTSWCFSSSLSSSGFTEKGSSKVSQQAIRVYGNSFKSGSVRLGRGTLIFTKNGGCQSVGMMSQAYLDNIKAQAAIVPVVPFNQKTNILHQTLWGNCPRVFSPCVFHVSDLYWASRSQVETQDSENSLKAILENFIITSVEEIHEHFDSIPSKKGTKILIWNIRRSKNWINPCLIFNYNIIIYFLFPFTQVATVKAQSSLW